MTVREHSISFEETPTGIAWFELLTYFLLLHRGEIVSTGHWPRDAELGKGPGLTIETDFLASNGVFEQPIQLPGHIKRTKWGCRLLFGKADDPDLIANIIRTNHEADLHAINRYAGDQEQSGDEIVLISNGFPELPDRERIIIRDTTGKIIRE